MSRGGKRAYPTRRKKLILMRKAIIMILSIVVEFILFRSAVYIKIQSSTLGLRRSSAASFLIRY